MDLQYKKNVYICESYGHQMITVDRHKGTTPFTTSCPECKGPTVSEFYRVDQSLIPTHEWYRPTGVEIDAVCQGKTPQHARQIRHHVMMGGLLLRQVQPTLEEVKENFISAVKDKQRGEESGKPTAAEDTKDDQEGIS